ncbi:MAG: nickel-dependent lactate racemase [bacterium]
MSIQLKYHDTTIEVPKPPAGNIEFLRGRTIEPLEDPVLTLRKSFENPIDSAPLIDMIPETGDISIMVSDRTRKTRLNILLPEIVNCLKKKNVVDNRIKSLICLGTHVPHTPVQIEELIGKDFLERFEVIESNQNNPDVFIDVGVTPSGTKVRFHEQAVNSGLLIVTGGITFHYFAGFSGGRKSFLPGISHVSTIQKNHRWTYMRQNGEFVRNQDCSSARLDGNPVSDDMEESYKLMTTPSFLVNVIVTPTGEIADIFCGDVIKAHRTGCARLSELYSMPIDYKADIVIASAGGHPTDINLLQTHKSMINASRVVKPGGTVFLAARCVEDFSMSDYPEFVLKNSRKKLIERLMENYEILGGTTDNLMSIADNFRLFFHSGLDSETLIAMGVRPFNAGQGNWDEVFKGIDINSSCYIMPDASKFLPVLNGH